MLKIAELIELADLFDRWGHTKAADLCDTIIAEAADIESDREVVLMRALAEKNFEAVKEQIRHGYTILVLTPEKRKLEGDASTEISYVRGEVVNSLNGQKIDARTAPVVFENEKKKAAKDGGAVLYIESGAVKYVYPKETGMHVLKDFFNKKVSIKQDLSSEMDALIRKHKPAVEPALAPEPENKGVGGVKLF